MPATAQTTDFDPDLDQAIEDLRAVYAEIVEARRKREALNRTVDMHAIKAAQAHIGDLRGQITARARRICIDGDALMAILAQEYELRKSHKRARRPSRRQMTKALTEAVTASAVMVEQWRAEEARVQRELSIAQRRAVATDKALKAYGGAQ